MNYEELANKLLCVLSAEMMEDAKLFEYVCWLSEIEQQENVPGELFLCMASDGTTCWGKTYRAAVVEAMKHDEPIRKALKQLE